MPKRWRLKRLCTRWAPNPVIVLVGPNVLLVFVFVGLACSQHVAWIISKRFCVCVRAGVPADKEESSERSIWRADRSAHPGNPGSFNLADRFYYSSIFYSHPFDWLQLRQKRQSNVWSIQTVSLQSHIWLDVCWVWRGQINMIPMPCSGKFTLHDCLVLSDHFKV